MVRSLLIIPFLAVCASSSSAAELRDVHEYREMCDASAVISVGDDFFLAANDEDNTLRLFRRDAGGEPTAEFKLDSALRVRRPSPEVDIEGAARLGDVVYWIGSHGNNKDGEPRPNRHRFFATRLTGAPEQLEIEVVGTPYTKLLDALAAEARLADCHWNDLSGLKPEQPGAVNIEGLAATPVGTLWIAFRNPIPTDKALIVELQNPGEVINGHVPVFARIARLDLAASGIRSRASAGR